MALLACVWVYVPSEHFNSLVLCRIAFICSVILLVSGNFECGLEVYVY